MIIAAFAGYHLPDVRKMVLRATNFQNALRRGSTHTGVLWLSAFLLFNRIINF